MKKRKYIIFIFLFLISDIVKANDFFAFQWIALCAGRTNGAFKHNSGNRNGIGLQFSETLNSKKDFNRLNILFKLGKQHRRK
jgi:hypothetical protein